MKFFSHTYGCRRMATGGTDALATLWDLTEVVCMATVSEMEWPIRAVGFSHDGQLLACGAEDDFVMIVNSRDASEIHRVIAKGLTTHSLDWHPKKLLLAFAGEQDVDKGIITVFGMPES